MTAALLAVPARHAFTGEPNGLAVERGVGPGGEPLIELLPLDELGRYAGDGLALDVAAAAELGARLAAFAGSAS